AAVGTTTSFVASHGINLWLLKMDSDGNMLWNRSFGGTTNDEGRGITEAANGDLIMVGYSVSYGSYYLDPWIIRTDSNGIEIWNRTYQLGYTGWGMSAIETSSGDIAICGYKQNQSTNNTNDAFFIKTDSSGEEILNRTWGTDGDEVARYLIETNDGNFLLVGDSEPFNGIEMITLWKLDNTGSEIWKRTYGGRSWYMGYRVAQLSGGDIFAFGLIMSMPGVGLDLVLIKADSTGKAQWTKTYGTSGNDRPESMTLDITGVTMVGSTSSSGSDDIYIVRVDLSGTETWSKQYGGSGRNIGIEALASPFGIYIMGYSDTWGPGFSGAFLLNLTSTGEGAPGIFRSVDMMNGISASSLKEMTYTAGFQSDASIKIRFSKDGTTWGDSNMNAGLYTTLSSGSGRILLHNLNGFEEGLLYELTFQCSSGDPGGMSSLAFVYNCKGAYGTLESYPFEAEENVTWGNIGMDLDLPAGTTAAIRIRSAPTIGDLIDVNFSGPDGTGDTSYSDRDMIWSGNDMNTAIQILVNLTTDDVKTTPTLLGLNISYDIPGRILSTDISYNSGNIDDTFNFTVEFIDPDNDLPDDVQIEIDDENRTMVPIGEDVDITDGRLYGFETGLDTGNHTYRFFIQYGDLVLFSESSIVNVLPGPLQSLEIAPADITVTADEGVQFHTVGYDRAGNIVEASTEWEVTGGGTVDEFGYFTADQVGAWTVFANSSFISGQANFNVTPGELVSLEVLTDIYSITADENVQLGAVGHDANGNEIEIDPVWEVEGGGSVDQSGLYEGDIVGFWKVYANLSGLSAFEIIDISPGNLSRIVVEPDDVVMDLHENVQFSAEGFDTDWNWVSIIPRWEASGGNMQTTGFFTAEIPGTWTVYCNFSGISGEATIVINRTTSADDDDDDDVADDDDTSDKEKGPGLLIGIIIATALVLIVLVIVILLLMRKKKEPEETPEEKKPEEPAKTLEQVLYADLYPDQEQPSPVQTGEIIPEPEKVPGTIQENTPPVQEEQNGSEQQKEPQEEFAQEAPAGVPYMDTAVPEDRTAPPIEDPLPGEQDARSEGP
ncbi:MAG: hypothetical protein U9R75_08955, partial [Candidatus Thermoplasmatota archaeon]|nr:hypothetical protein [Candidatus Thermoplasmatota archaeon]